MSNKIQVVLVPDAGQAQLLSQTMDRYCELCNYLSRIVFERNCDRPINLYYWVVDHRYKNLYYQVRHQFPDINSNMVTMAFRRVSKEYIKQNPFEALEFRDIADYSSYMISLVFISPKPINMGMLTISTLAGRQKIQITFDDIQREHLCISVNLKKYCEYKLLRQEEKFYLSRNLSNSKIKEYYQTR